MVTFWVRGRVGVIGVTFAVVVGMRFSFTGEGVREGPAAAFLDGVPGPTCIRLSLIGEAVLGFFRGETKGSAGTEGFRFKGESPEGVCSLLPDTIEADFLGDAIDELEGEVSTKRCVLLLLSCSSILSCRPRHDESSKAWRS